MFPQSQPKTIHVNGTDLAYVEQGTGEATVFVHGSASDFRVWLPQLGPFGERYRAIAYSRRGHYPHPWDNMYIECSAIAHAEDLAAFIRALGVGPAHVQGNSYGAYTSLLLAANHPELVRTLVLGEPPILPWLHGIPGGDALVGEFMESAFIPAAGALQGGNLEQGMRAFIDGVLGQGSIDQLPPPARAMILDNAPAMRVETSTDPNVYFPPFDCEDAARVETATLLVTGALSPRMFHLIVDELERCMPNTRRVEIPRASHLIHGMNPEDYNAAVLAFLAEH